MTQTVLNLKSLLFLGLCIIAGVGGQMSLKFGMGKLESGAGVGLQFYLRAFANSYILFGFFLYALSSLLWLAVLSRLPLSLAYPALSVSYVLILFLSRYVLGESVGAFRIIGVVLICLGVAFIGKSGMGGH